MVRSDVEMTFSEHIEELRKRVLYALLGLVVSASLCGIFWRDLTSALIRPYKEAYDKLAIEAAKSIEPPAPDKALEPAPKEPTPVPPGTDAGVADILRRIEARLDAFETRLNKVAPPTEPDKPEVPYSGKFPPPRLIQGGPLTGYITIITLCIIVGVIGASPWILYQIWSFIGVGLHPRERKFVHIYGPFSFLMFIAGAALFYFLLLPQFLGFLMGVATDVLVDGVPMVDPSFFLNDYFKFVAVMTLIFGIVFQTPLVVMFLARTRIIPLRVMAKQQRLVIMIMVVIAAILTPTVDPVGLAAMAVPLILLYELGLLLAWIAMRKDAKAEAKAAAEEKPEDYDPWAYEDAESRKAAESPEATAIEPPTDASTSAATDTYEDPYGQPAEDQGEDQGAQYGQEDQPAEGETTTEPQPGTEGHETPTDLSGESPYGEGPAEDDTGVDAADYPHEGETPDEGPTDTAPDNGGDKPKPPEEPTNT